MNVSYRFCINMRYFLLLCIYFNKSLKNDEQKEVFIKINKIIFNLNIFIDIIDKYMSYNRTHSILSLKRNHHKELQLLFDKN